jgi:hypothetical protein
VEPEAQEAVLLLLVGGVCLRGVDDRRLAHGASRYGWPHERAEGFEQYQTQPYYAHENIQMGCCERSALLMLI